MRIIYFGTPQPAADILEKLIATKHEIVCVVTQPDRPQGRGRKLSPSLVKEVALKHDLPLQQPEAVKNNTDFKCLLESFKADVAVVVAYGKILPKELLSIPKNGFINVHASLLPKYRGAAPIQWALLNGEKETGITIFRLVEALDAGSIYSQVKVEVTDDDNYLSLSRKLFSEAADLLLKTLDQIEKNKINPIKQNEAAVTYAPSLTKESGEIDWRKSAAEIHNRIRALVNWPTAHTFYHGKRLKLLKASVWTGPATREEALPGTVLEIIKDEGFIVTTGAGNILVAEVQPESKKVMSAYHFCLGHDVKKGEKIPS